ncbi:MAG: protein translocase subunit SecD [Cardiobacteriaceae bacterium]|nr:protein translocase subunit SecD [Cardiobacteriaceae bacterium]
MKHTYPLWKYVVVLLAVILGFLLALPNWFGKSPAVQMNFAQEQEAASRVDSISELLKKKNIPFTRITQKDTHINILFAKTDEQIAARDELNKVYPEAQAAVNLLSNSPEWLQSLGLAPMNLGLDLRGGVSFLLQVDSKELFERKSNELIEGARATLEKEKIEIKASDIAEQGGAIIWFADDAARGKAENQLHATLAQDVQRLHISKGGLSGLQLQYTEQGISNFKRRAAEQNRMRMASRVNSLGVAEPSIQVVGDDRILVQLPGIQDVNQAKEILGSTATLEFYMVDEQGNVAEAAKLKRAPFGSKLAYFEDGRPILLKRRVIMSGEHIIDASAQYGDQGEQVSVALDSAGGAQMGEITRENLHKQMATLYVEYVPVTKEDGTTVVEKRETVANSATIQGQFSNHFQITGVRPLSRAQKLAATLRAGSLVAPVYIIEERTIGPSAGQKNIDQGVRASQYGLILIAVFMVIYYRTLGVLGILSLAANLMLLIALMSWIGAVLTLPGIAGIVLTLGMAVDAHVLAYERIREALNKGMKTIEAVGQGFNDSFGTIMDANITTLIVAMLLFSFGTGPIRGFAVTLSIGILTSVFSAVMINRALIEFCVLRRNNPVLKF